MKKLAIIGSKVLAQYIAHYAVSDDKFEIAGFFDDFIPVGTKVGPSVVLGETSQVPDFYRQGAFDALLVGVGYNAIGFRQAIFERLKGTFPFARLIHSSTYVDKSSRAGDGVVILPGCTIDKNVVLEDNVVITPGSLVAHDSRVGAHTFLSSGVNVAGFVEIGKRCFVGIGATIVDNVRLCDDSKVGAGAVVTHDIDQPDSFYVGVPARPLPPRRPKR